MEFMSPLRKERGRPGLIRPWLNRSAKGLKDRVSESRLRPARLGMGASGH
jgi:hypothetical protein